MLVTLNWLKDFVDISDTPQNIADKLTLAGMEVEEIIFQDRFIDHVRIGKILEIKQHPNADRLTVCRVDLGDKEVQIITSARNIREGDLVPVSLPGAKLANGVEIKKSQMRGVDSDGMFCSGEELGIGDDVYPGASENKILVFKEDVALGTPVAKFLGLDDVIFDINITANRPDCNSVVGIAKELAAIYKVPFKNEDLGFVVDKTKNVNDYISVEVLDDVLCPRYMAAALTDVKVKKSPKWLANRLNAVGIKSINTLVDITNYVLIEYGQPMHAFDQSHIDGKKIIVRPARLGESIECLDGGQYELKPEDLVIANPNRPMCIAGVIGGLNSCVEQSTKTVIFESACFERKSVRVTSRKFGIRTDSSARFERGVDIMNPELGMKKALKLVNLLDTATIVGGVIDEHKEEIKTRTVVSSLKKIESILGVKIPNEDVLTILNNLQIKSTISGDTLTSVVTPERFDIECANDIAEELIRFYGYDVYNNTTKKVLSETSYTVGKNDPVLAEQNKLAEKLVDFGFYQAINYSMVPRDHAKKLGLSDQNMVVISNPLSEELSVMRLSLAHGLLTNVSNNLKRGNYNFKLFEFGRTYEKSDENYDVLPNETNMTGIVICSNKHNFFTLKGVIECLLNPYQLATRLVRSTSPILHPGVSADIIDLQTRKVLASFGEIHPKIAKTYDIPTNVLYAEINTDLLVTKREKKIVVHALSKFPTVERDLAVVVKEEVTADEIVSTVKKACGDLCENVEIFDIYRSKQLGEGLKSVAFKLRLTSYEKTLIDEETNGIIARILRDLAIRCGAKLR